MARTTAFSAIRDRLSEILDDYYHSTVTTALAASKVIIDTTLNERTSKDDVFNRQWALITSENNDGENRKVSGYSQSATQLTVLGANFTSDSAALATYELHKYNPDQKKRAINQAAREIYPDLFKPLKVRTLITGNALPNCYFDDWTSSSYPDKWALSVVTSAADTTYVRGGTKSAKVTRAGTDGYLYCSQGEWERLIDLQDRQISFRCWVWASTASQAYIEIYTKQADGTAQTETSDAHSGGSEWELLEIEDFQLNDDLTDIQFRLKVITSDGSAYFTGVRTVGGAVQELLLPVAFQKGVVCEANVQYVGYADYPCDDLSLDGKFAPCFGWEIKDDATLEYIRFKEIYPAERTIELIGYGQLEDTLDTDTNTITLDGSRLELLVAKAAYCLFRMLKGTPSSDDRSKFEKEMLYWDGEVSRLKRRFKMTKPPVQTARHIG